MEQKENFCNRFRSANADDAACEESGTSASYDHAPTFGCDLNIPIGTPRTAAAVIGLAVGGHLHLMLVAVAAHRVVAARVGDGDGKPGGDVAAAVGRRLRLGAGDVDQLLAIIALIVDPAFVDLQRPARLLAAGRIG